MPIRLVKSTSSEEYFPRAFCDFCDKEIEKGYEGVYAFYPEDGEQGSDMTLLHTDCRERFFMYNPKMETVALWKMPLHLLCGLGMTVPSTFYKAWDSANHIAKKFFKL